MSAARIRVTVGTTVTFLVAALLTVAATSAAIAAAAPDPGTYQALNPARILDTRTGNGAPTAPVAAAATLDVTVLGQGGIPASGVSAVVFNLTDAGPTTYGFITAYPAGQPLPLASSINFSAGETRAHQVVVAPGTNGQVALYNGSAAPVDLVADVVGYYTAGTPTDGGEFAPLTPARILDTRTGNGAPRASLAGQGGRVTVRVAGRGGVPSSTGVSSVIVNLTATRATTAGYLAATPGTSTSNVNFPDGRSVSNLIVAALDPNGSLTVTSGARGHVDVVADVTGYVVGGPPSAVGRTGAVVASRLIDTRLTHDAIPASSSIDLAVAGHGRVPLGATAAMLNVTAATAPTSGFLATYPTGVTRPTSSTLNFDHNTVANLVIASLGSDGKVTIYNGSSAPLDIVVDVSGYVGAVPGGLSWSAPATMPNGTGELREVSCATTLFCVAHDPLSVWSWDGTRWSSPTRIGDEVSSITCPVVGFCAGVVDRDVLIYNGSTWASSHWPGSHDDVITSLSCSSATFCVAVGDTDGQAGIQTWTYHGATWAHLTIAMGQPEWATTVSCVSTVFCLATNSANGVARFDGRTWTVTGAAPFAAVQALSCVTATFCVAVGRGVSAAYNGAAWGPAMTLSGQEAAPGATFQVSCASVTLCLAINSSGYEYAYDGSTWSTAFQLDPSEVGGARGVSCVPTRACLLLSDDRSFLGS